MSEAIYLEVNSLIMANIVHDVKLFKKCLQIYVKKKQLS